MYLLHSGLQVKFISFESVYSNSFIIHAQYVFTSRISGVGDFFFFFLLGATSEETVHDFSRGVSSPRRQARCLVFHRCSARGRQGAPSSQSLQPMAPVPLGGNCRRTPSGRRAPLKSAPTHSRGWNVRSLPSSRHEPRASPGVGGRTRERFGRGPLYRRVRVRKVLTCPPHPAWAQRVISRVSRKRGVSGPTRGGAKQTGSLFQSALPLSFCFC